GVRERAAAVAVAQRPDARRAGAQFVVDGAVAAFIHVHAGLAEPETCGVRPATHGHQHVAARDPVAVQRRPDRIAIARERDVADTRADADAVGLQDPADRGRYVLVLAADQARPLLRHGHVRAEAPVHLRVFQADVAAAD